MVEQINLMGKNNLLGESPLKSKDITANYFIFTVS